MLSWRYTKRFLTSLLCAVFIMTLFTAFTPSSNSDMKDAILDSPEVSPELVKYGPNEYKYNGFHIVVSGIDDGLKKKKGKKIRAQTVTVQGEQTCKIPKLDISAKEVIQFFKPSSPFVCTAKEQNWAYVDSQGKFALIDKRKEAICEVAVFNRVNDDKLTYSNPKSIKNGDAMPDDFTKISCKEGNANWNGLLMSAVPKPKLKKKAQDKKKPVDWSGLNVYFLGLDSLSQMTYRRKLPKTVAYLENVMEGVVLNGYNIVGDGTPQAFIPILTAQTEEELPLTRKRFPESKYVDEAYPFIWNNYSDSGYVTAYGEDSAKIGTFTYRLKGFKNQPTDHYTRTFFQESEKEYGIATCTGSESIHNSWFRYAKEFMRGYSDVPRFLLMHLSLFSHDDINMVGSIDDDFSSHLKEMFENGDLNNSLVILMADHGHRFAKLRSTHQGQLEERLPFFSLALPKKFREGKGKIAWQNLINNKDLLTTPFDIHATLMDVLHWPSEEKLKNVQDPYTRSLSLFRSIPMKRTCDQAGIQPHWCTCLNWENGLSTPEEHSRSLRIAAALVGVINAQTKSERALCAPLRLKRLIHVKKLVPNKSLLQYKNVKDVDGFVPDLSGTTHVTFTFYQIKLETTPGRAIYEVTLRYYNATNKLDVDLTAMSHVTKFGDDPHCIIDKNYFLATYCVCYDKITTADLENRS